MTGPWKRRVEIGPHVLFEGDCLEVLPTLGKVDAVVTDPPYGNANHDGDWNARLNEHRGIESKPIANDDEGGMRRVVDGMLRAIVPLMAGKASACCCFCGGGGGPRPVFAWLAERMDRDGLQFFHSVIWDKRNPGLGQRYRRQHEMMMVAHVAGQRIRWNPDRQPQPNIYSEMPPRERAHPNEKPLRMMQHFVGLHSVEGDTILDPFAGSGTTGVACVRAGRRFIGVELDPGFFDIACERIRKEMEQPRLDLPAPPRAEQAALTFGEPGE